MPLLGREKVEFELKEGIKTRMNSNLKGVYFSGLGNIIAGTPADKGLHRNSWFLSVGTSPVAKGSYIKKSKSYEILSVNGFSKQAPKGWVRSTIIAMQNKLRSL